MRPARLDARLCVFVSGIFCAMPLFAPPSPCQTVGESPQQTNERIQRLSAAVRTAPHDYVIGAGDVLDVEVFDVKELKSKPITVVGAVIRPMVYQADGPVTLLEVLAQAGGVANDAGDTVIVTRPVPPSDLPQDGSSASQDPPSLGPEVTPAPVANATLQSASPPQVKPPAAVDASAAPQPASLAKPPARPENTITINLNELVESGDATN